MLVILREHEMYRDDEGRPLPVASVPREKRIGTLQIILCLEGLAISGSETEKNVYPQGAPFNYTRGCEVFLGVFPRGGTPEQYYRWQRDLKYRTVFLQVRTPLVISPAAMLYPSGVNRPGVTGLEHMTLVPPDKLADYLTATLLLIGVGSADMEVVVRHVTELLQSGESQLHKLPRRRS